MQVGAAVHAERLPFLEKLNESRVRNVRTQAALQLRETQYQDLKSRFPSVVKEAEELRKKFSKAVAPPELKQRIKELVAQATAKDEAYAKLSSEMEALHAAHLRDVSLLKDALKEKEQQVSRCDHFEEVCSQLRLEVSQ